MKPDPAEKPGLMDRARGWRLPVRYRVPPRNDLIAFALMALAFGLMVGLAIAPGWGNAGPTGPLIALPGTDAPAEGTTDEGDKVASVDLQPPSGTDASVSETTSMPEGPAPESDPSTSLTADPGPESAPDPVEPPGDESPATDYADPPKKDDPGEAVDPGPSMTATVVGADDAGYAVADKAGNLLYIHYSAPNAKPPQVGRRIATDIDPVDNGTFVQARPLENKGKAGSTKLSGFISFIDADSGVMTLSSRGASVAVNAASAIGASENPPGLGSWVTSTVAFRKAAAAPRSAEIQPADEPEEEGDDEPDIDPIALPTLTAKSIEVEGQPAGEVDLAGPATWDRAKRVLAIAADSFGVLNRELEIKVPRQIGLKGIENGLSYATSVAIGKDGTLTLTGLSANFSLEAAGDPAEAFGTHAR